MLKKIHVKYEVYESPRRYNRILKSLRNYSTIKDLHTVHEQKK